MSTSGGASAGAGAGGGLIFELEKKNVVLCKQISTAIDKNLKLDRKVDALKARVKDAHGRSLKQHRASNRGTFMSKIGSGTAMETMKKRQMHEVKLLETKKNRVTVMCDKVNDKCLELRRQIDDMRRDAINQNSRFTNVQREVERVKLEMAKVLDVANKVDGDLREVQEERQRMADAADKDKAEFYDTHAAVLSFKPRPLSKKREAVETMDVTVSGLTPAQRIRRRMKELAAEASAIRSEDTAVVKRVEQYEAAFEALRRCTGLADLDDIVRVFVEEEDRKLRHLQVIQDLIDQHHAEEATRREIAAEMEEYQKMWGSHDKQQQAVIDDFAATLRDLKKEASEAESRKAAAALDLDRLGEALHRLFYSLDCEAVGVEMTMHALTVDRERRGSFFNPVRRPSDVHKEIMSSMKEEVAKGNVATLEKALAKPKSKTEEEVMGEEGMDGDADSRPPSPPLYHKAVLTALSPDPDDDTYLARTMGTPTRRGTRSHARADVEEMMKTGVTHDNMQRYLAIVEQRVVHLADQLNKMQEAEGRPPVESKPVAKDGGVTVLAPPMEDFDAMSNELDRAAANYANDLSKSLKQLKTSKLRGMSPAWRTTTPALSPVVPGRRSEAPSKRKPADPLPKVVSRQELEEEVMRDLGDTDLSHFIRRVRQDVDASGGEEGGAGGHHPPPHAGGRRGSKLTRSASTAAPRRASTNGSRPSSPIIAASASMSSLGGDRSQV